MQAVSDGPRGFNECLESLKQCAIGIDFDAGLAGLLRMLAGTMNNAIVLTAGKETIPYAAWLQDGMTMDSRLILHSESAQEMQLIRPYFCTDIRVALHQQDLAEFLTDIQQHRFDFILADLDGIASAVVPTLLERLADHGLLAGIGTNPPLDDLIYRCGNSHFFSRIGTCALLSRKSLQHRAVRRGGRRRRTQTG